MKAHVLGLGNILMKDDAAGPWAVALLESEWDLPAGVEAIDLGTPGLNLLPYLSGGVDAAILVDAVRARAAPGTVRRYRRGAILAVPPQPRLSPHDPGLKEALLAAELAGDAPGELLLVGIVPERIEKGLGLTPVVQRALGDAVGAVRTELERLGLPPRRRSTPQPPRIWWEGGAQSAAAAR